MLTKNIFILALLTHSFLWSSAASVKTPKNMCPTYIVSLRDREEIPSHKHPSYTIPVGQPDAQKKHQQIIISCPTNPPMLFPIKKNSTGNNQIELATIIAPVLKTMKELLEQGSSQRPETFLVHKGSAFSYSPLDGEQQATKKIFMVEIDEISKAWFDQREEKK